MEWCRDIEKELEIIDLQWVLDKDIFGLQGSKPLLRKCAAENLVTSRDPPVGLPMALYDSMWISRLTKRDMESLKISDKRFPWMKVAMV